MKNKEEEKKPEKCIYYIFVLALSTAVTLLMCIVLMSGCGRIPDGKATETASYGEHGTGIDYFDAGRTVDEYNARMESGWNQDDDGVQQ